MNLDVFRRKAFVVFLSDPDAHELYHSACDAAQVVVHASSADHGNSHHSDFFLKLFFDVEDFRHDFFVQIIVLAEPLGIFHSHICPEKFYIGHEIALNVPERMVRLSCVGLFAGGENERGIGAHKGSRNENFVKDFGVVQDAFDNHS